MAQMDYKGTGRIHSFRGNLEDGSTSTQRWQDKIRIQGPVGDVAWRITKLELIPQGIGTADTENLVMVWREEQDPTTTAPNSIDFRNDELLAAGFFGANTQGTAELTAVVFDNALFVRNIWVTHYDHSTNQNINYYIEIEEVKVSKAGMAQLALAAARRLEEK